MKKFKLSKEITRKLEEKGITTLSTSIKRRGQTIQVVIWKDKDDYYLYLHQTTPEKIFVQDIITM